jgi:hypothetical protein
MMGWLIIPLLFWLSQPLPIEDPGQESHTYEARYLYGNLDTKVANVIISLTPDEWEGQDAYRIDLSIKVKPIFRLFLHAKYAVEGRITRPGMTPLYYYSNTGKVEGLCKYTEGEEGVYYWRKPAKSPEPEIFAYPNDGKTMELMSMLFFARGYDFVEGEPVAVKALIAGRLAPGTITMEGVDTEKYPGHEAQILHLRMSERGIMENGSGTDVYIWREAGGSHLVLGLQAALGKHGMMMCNIIDLGL